MSMPTSPAADTAAALGLSTSLPVDDRQMSMLPSGDSGAWPPARLSPVAYQHTLWNAWWVGDRQRLAEVYYNLGANSPSGRAFFATTGERGMPVPRPGQYRGGLLGSVEYSFWLPGATRPLRGKSAPSSMSRSRVTSPRPRRASCSAGLRS